MKRFKLALAALAFTAATLPTQAQQKRQATRSPTEVTIVNNRQSALVEFELANAQGQRVGAISAPLAPGKRVAVKLAKGAPCAMTVSASFEDEFENAGSQIDACKDKVIRFGN